MNRLRARLADPTSARSAWSLIGIAIRALFSLIALYGVARAIGTSGYGVYAGIVAYAALIAPLNTMGVGEALVQHVARDRTQIQAAWGRVLVSLVTIGLALLVIFVAAATVILDDVDGWTILLLALAEFLSAGLVSNHMRACLALDRYPAAAAHAAGGGLVRLVAVLVFWIEGSQDLRRLAVYLLVAIVIASVVSGGWLLRLVGRPTFDRAALGAAVREGAPFALGQTSNATQANVDKVMLLAYGFRLDNGVYAAGFRLITYAMMPMMAIFSATLPQFFRHGEAGIEAAHAYGQTVRRRVLSAALFASAIAIVGAPVAAWALADQFGGIVPVVAVLLAYPVLKGLQLLLGDALTGSGQQSFRARAQLGTAALNVALNLYFIPRYSWEGAVFTTYVSEIVFLLVLRVGMAQARRDEAMVAAG